VKEPECVMCLVGRQEIKRLWFLSLLNMIK